MLNHQFNSRHHSVLALSTLSPDSSFQWRSLSLSSSGSNTKSFATPILHRALSSYRNAEDRAGSRAGDPWALMVNYNIVADASLSAVRSTSGTIPAPNQAGLDRNHYSPSTSFFHNPLPQGPR
ncbi:hypothetical protein Ddc_24781 [Ditylenchus destructor]|nr:hypothetical protein Ddc_24781 [Ditylenchus destructor]